jgi:hypothetical protein
VFADVRAGEGTTTLLLTLNVFLLLAGFLGDETGARWP